MTYSIVQHSKEEEKEEEEEEKPLRDNGMHEMRKRMCEVDSSCFAF